MNKVAQLAQVLLMIVILAALTPGLASTQDLDAELIVLAKEFDSAQFDTVGEAKVRALDTVRRRAAGLQKRYPNRAEPLCWEAWISVAQSEVIPDLSMLDKRQEALFKLEAAIAIDPRVYDGAPYASLGELHFVDSLLPFPYRYDDKEKALTYFHKALALNPSALEVNLGYANFLLIGKDYAGALKHAAAATQAPPLAERRKTDKALRARAEKIAAEAHAKIT